LNETHEFLTFVVKFMIMEWETENGMLVKDFRFENFDEAIQFVNKVAILANEVDHHPDILIHSWNKVKLTLITHSEKRITRKDHELASKIDNLPA
jgi:4a-hydroxytetrahydrobiopterin dehydratase